MKTFAVSDHVHPTLRCPIHGCAMCSLRAPNGGAFWACTSSLTTECDYTVSYDGVAHNHPAVVCRKSKNHSQGKSGRSLVLAQLIGRHGLSALEAVEWVDTLGLQECQRLVA